ncbi:Bacterial alpha-L-rhamnosidase [Brevundimonas sp. SH203]|uniref:family 78 glycoside hydrolase catalytic domain n=1 Tax=Brevundimonas sp. SH203 TaxID=345167 RepID=UPI0009CC1E29|nr:family 78 glycoside hydrolase catalytic domain [Brevundimonas sp. SH203]GAW40955.1 Bacterial alpha-L-rhamnosidase [Brevundimonas sp. SH203]
MSMLKLVLAGFACLAVAGTAQAGTIDRPSALAVDGAVNPIGIDASRPRLSWRPPAGRTQGAYQLRVGVSEQALLAGQVVWDTGRTTSSDAVAVVYQGPVLSSRERRVWQVRTWDGRGRASPWSDVASWEMGLLGPSDWTGAWIQRNAEAPKGWSDATVSVDFTLKGRQFDILFRASPEGKTYGEAYVWRIGEGDGGGAVLNAQVRRYPGGTRASVNQTTLRTIDLGMTADDLRQRRHSLSIEAVGDRILTRLDGRTIDEMHDGSQKQGTVGLLSAAPDAAVIHRLAVAPVDGEPWATDFADGDNPLSGGSLGPDGLILASGVPTKDIVIPLSHPAPLLRRSFQLGADQIASARLYVAAGGWADLTVNNRAVSELPMAPGWTDYGKRVLYQTYDVTSLLQAGENVLAAELGRGWYGVTEPNEWYFHKAPWHAEPSLRAQLEIVFVDGRRQVVTTGRDWVTADGPTLHDSIYAGERYDARRAPAGWRSSGFVGEGWTPALETAGPAGALAASSAEPIRPVETVSPVGRVEIRPGVWVFDFGRILTGRPVLRWKGAAGRTATLVLTEKKNADGSAQTTSGLIDAQLQTYRYTFAGRDVETWAPRFSYAGFRYVQVEGLDRAPDEGMLSAEIIHSDVPFIGAFESGEPLLNRIQQASRNALLNNMHGLMSDTPSLEKNGWTGDGQASAGAAGVNFDMARVWTKWLADFRDAQAVSGELPEIVPSTPYYGFDQTPGWSYIWGPTPAWDAALFVISDDLVRYYGDERVVADLYEVQKRLVDYTSTFIKSPDFTYSRGLGDYAGIGPFGPTDATSSAYYFHMVSTLARNAARLGRTEDAAHYQALAADVRDAYNRKYWDAQTHRYVTPAVAGGPTPPFSQTQNILPLAFGMAPSGEAQNIADAVAADLEARDYALTMGVYPLRHALTLLTDYGHVDTVYRVVTRTDQPSWGFWLANDISTMLEGWGLNSRSWNHHYFASVSDWFYKGLAGIRPGSPGYADVVIRPAMPQALDHASGRIETRRGEVRSAWRKAGDAVVLDVTIPGATRAEVWLPNGGERLKRAPRGSRFLRVEQGHAVYSAPPGAATFTFALK